MIAGTTVSVLIFENYNSLTPLLRAAIGAVAVDWGVSDSHLCACTWIPQVASESFGATFNARPNQTRW